jgi:tripartite-type tricarboxylate transporter receptor subunit TctC
VTLLRRRFLQLGAGAAALPNLLRVVWAQGYPTRPIKLIVPFPPGGINDAIARPWADKMKTRLGTVVIDNIGGASGMVGVAAAARAKPDGYTLVLANSANMVVAPAVSARSNYDPVRDFQSIYHMASGTGVFAVHPSSPVTTLKALVAYAKANPRKLSYGSPGPGTSNHLAFEILKLRTEAADIVHIPYRGAGPLLSDLIGGQIPLASLSMTGQVLDLHRSGKIRILAVMPDRVRGAPELPTIAESGVADVPYLSFFGLFAPKGTPAAIVQQISEATREAMKEQDLRQLYVTSGFEPDVDSSAEALGQILEDRIARLTAIIKSLGVKLE